MTTPTKTPQPRHAALPLSAPMLHVNDRTPSSIDKLATNKLLDFVRSSSPARTPIAFGSTTFRPQPSSPHRRRLSKASTISTASTITEPNSDVGGPSRPILHFRPTLWRRLDRDRETLNLDLFWPIKYDDEVNFNEEPIVFPFADLAPLHTFRHLRSLHLNGMMRSYQHYIWLTVWLNPDLTDLSLEMALEPVIAPDTAHSFTKIDQAWMLKFQKNKENVTPKDTKYEYLGAHGQGTLHDEFGGGEYLDRQAIALARLEAASISYRIIATKCLPIKKLALLGFVVDTGPFSFFDPGRLRQIIFKEHCVDAGFALPTIMRRTCEVVWTGSGSARRVEAGTVKAVRVRKSKRAGESGVTTGLRSKLSGILPKWRSKSYDI